MHYQLLATNTGIFFLMLSVSGLIPSASAREVKSPAESGSYLVVRKQLPADKDPVIDAKTVYEEKSLLFTGGEYTDEEFRYRLLKPAKIEKDQKYPLVLFLHGAGERGTDNALQLLYFPTQMAQPQWRDRFPCYILAPQCRNEKRWMEVDWSSKSDPEQPEVAGSQMQMVMQILEQTLKDEQVDPDRVYLTGLSMGGFGSFDLASRHPDWFAAVAAICGAADPKKITVLKDVPVWIAHGDADSVVSVERSRSATKALRDAGGKPVYVELPGVGHNSWTPSYQDEEGLIPWMFQQKRAAK